jgi:hypothetical protein
MSSRRKPAPLPADYRRTPDGHGYSVDTDCCRCGREIVYREEDGTHGCEAAGWFGPAGQPVNGHGTPTRSGEDWYGILEDALDYQDDDARIAELTRRLRRAEEAIG